MGSSNTNYTLKKYHLIVLVLILFVFSFDLITKILLATHFDGFTRYSAIPKLIIEVGLIFFLFKNDNVDRTNILYGLALIVISFVNFFISKDAIDSQVIFQKIYVLNKFLYLFLFATVLLSFEKQKSKKIIRSIRDIVIIIGLINGLFIIVGLFTDFEILRSYRYTERFGFNGLFVKTSEASYMYILLIITTYYEYIKTKKKGLLCLFFIFVSLLIGTKAVWLFLLLLGGIHFAFHNRTIIRNISRIGIVLATIGLYFYQDYIEKFIVNSFSFGPSLYEEYGFLTVLTSGRDLLFIKAMAYMETNWSTGNYLVGGINLEAYGVEFEFVDIFLFFGIIGLIIYLYFIKRIFFNTYFDKHKLLLFIALMLVASFAGNFFLSIICSIFAFIVFQNMENMHEKTS